MEPNVKLEQLLDDYLSRIKNSLGLDAEDISIEIQPSHEFTPISPFAEPYQISDLVGPNLQAASYQLSNCKLNYDELSSRFVNANNEVLAQLDIASATLRKGRSALDRFKFLDDDGDGVEWIADTFSTGVHVKTLEGLTLDLDAGSIGLATKSSTKITGLNVNADWDELRAQGALPGNNAQVQGVSFADSKASPTVSFDTTSSRNLNYIADDLSSTYFEVERNFIIPNQPLSVSGKGYVYDVTANIQNVEKVTQNLDWKVGVVWPDSDARVEETPIAQFREIDPSKVVNPSINNINEDPSVSLTVTLTLKTPVTVSEISLTPYLKDYTAQLKLEQLDIFLQGLGTPVPVVRNFSFNQTNGDTNEDSVKFGSRFGVPSRGIPVTKVVARFRGYPGSQTKFGHPFHWINVHRRSVRNYGLFKSVDRQDIPQRISIFEGSSPVIKANNAANYVGPVGEFGITPSNKLGQTQTERKNGPLSFAASVSPNEIVNPPGPLNSLKNVAAAAGSAILGSIAAQAINSILQFGGFERTLEVTAQDAGYDVLAGYRSSVALRDFSLWRNVYVSSGEFISTIRKFNSSCNVITLFVVEEIPSEWNKDFKWIEYFVSPDGIEWIPIEPSVLGSNEQVTLRLDKPTKTIQLKAKVNGNPSDEFLTARFTHYAIKGALIQ